RRQELYGNGTCTTVVASETVANRIANFEVIEVGVLHGPVIEEYIFAAAIRRDEAVALLHQTNLAVETVGRRRHRMKERLTRFGLGNDFEFFVRHEEAVY